LLFVRNYIHYSLGYHQRSTTSDKGNHKEFYPGYYTQAD
jgi:hypothetical protein